EVLDQSRDDPLEPGLSQDITELHVLEEGTKAAHQVDLAQALPNHLRSQPFVLDGVRDAVDEFLSIARQHAGVGQVPSPLEYHFERDVVAQSSDECCFRDGNRNLGGLLEPREYKDGAARKIDRERNPEGQIALV